jgi:hypothetical protein
LTAQLWQIDGTKATVTPTLSAQKVTASGLVLLLYNKGDGNTPKGYRWQQGSFLPIKQQPSWETSYTITYDESGDGSGPYLTEPYFYLSWVLANVSDMNDSGEVVGSVWTDQTTYDYPIFPYYGEFSQPAYWPSGSADASMMGLPANEVTSETLKDSYFIDSAGDVIIYTATIPITVAPVLIDDSGICYGNFNDAGTAWIGQVPGYGGIGVLSSGINSSYGTTTWNPAQAAPQNILDAKDDPAPPTADSCTIEAVSPSGSHVLKAGNAAIGISGGKQVLEAVTRLDGTIMQNPSVGSIDSTPYTGPINNVGRYLATVHGAASWGELDNPLQAIPGLAGGGAELAINNADEILGQKSDRSYAIYTWTPPVPAQGSQQAVSGFYVENKAIFNTSPGWAVTALASSMNDTRLLVGQITQIADSSGNSIPASQQTVAPALFVPAALLVDANRDGVIDVNDVMATTAAAPFRFWINDGVDGQSPDPGEGLVQDSLDPINEATGNPVQTNAQQFDVTCERDLENFARLWVSIGGLSQAIASGNITIGLEWHSNTGDAVDGWGPNDGAPAINIYAAVPPHGKTTVTGGAEYLTDPSTATDQVSVAIGTVARGSPFYFSASELASLTATNSNAYFLFEGVTRGTGRLVITFNTGTSGSYTKIGESGGVYMDLKEIKELYERWTVGDGPTPGLFAGGGGVPAATAGISNLRLPPGVLGLQYSSGASGLSVPTDPNGNKYILLVHGWNMPPWEKDAFAETALKRLYWQGYKGKFGTFEWPTTYSNSANEYFNNTQEISSYDDGEFSAWQSAVPLEQLMVTLNRAYGSNVYLLAHSMGNVVAGEALRIAGQSGAGQLANTYVASQGAVPGHCYDPSLAGPDLLNYVHVVAGVQVQLAITTPNIYNSWLIPPNASVGARSNFYNVNDYALNYWQLDEELKPDSHLLTGGSIYSYGSFDTTTVQDLFQKGITDTALHLGDASNVQDRYEIMAYAAQARSIALGAVPDISRAVFAQTQNLQSPTIWPTDTFAPDNQPQNQYAEHQWHSAEFRFTNADQQNYWHALLNQFQLLPSQ